MYYKHKFQRMKYKNQQKVKRTNKQENNMNTYFKNSYNREKIINAMEILSGSGKLSDRIDFAYKQNIDYMQPEYMPDYIREQYLIVKSKIHCKNLSKMDDVELNEILSQILKLYKLLILMK